MPHIHTEPGQYDFTVSAWIFRRDEDGLKVLVHMHRKIKKYMQIGGHIELNESPWQAISHELKEESGYSLDELKLVQPEYMPVTFEDAAVSPVPTFVSAFQPVVGHYHADFCYAFMAYSLPENPPHEAESQELRWMTFGELRQALDSNQILTDVVEIYESLRDIVEKPYMKLVDTSMFTLGHPPLNDDAVEKTTN